MVCDAVGEEGVGVRWGGVRGGFKWVGKLFIRHRELNGVGLCSVYPACITAHISRHVSLKQWFAAIGGFHKRVIQYH